MKNLTKQQLEAKERREVYYLNPKLCKECKQPIDYDKRLNVFCGHNCAATHNNNKRGNNFRSEESKSLQSEKLKSRIYTEIKIDETILCFYGCNQPAQFITSNGRYCCGKSSSSCLEIKRKNAEATRNQHRNGNRKGIRTFDDNALKKAHESRLRNLKKVEDEIMLKPFEEWKDYLQRRRILAEQNDRCLHCSIKEWNRKPITLELDHINGVRSDNTRENLRFLCPNCHSQTQTYKGRNIVLQKKKISDEELLLAFKKEGNISKALESCNLNPTGGNFDRLKKLINLSML